MGTYNNLSVDIGGNWSQDGGPGYVCTTEDEVDPETISTAYFMHILYELVVPIVFSLIMFVGLIGNILVVYVLCSRAQMRTPMNLLLLNLAIADMCFLCICVPLTAYHYASTTWQLGAALCKFLSYPLFVAFYVNMYTLVFISCWRYVSVAHSSKTTKLRTKRVAVMLMVGVWVTMLLLNSPTLFVFEIKTQEEPCSPAYQYCGLSDINTARIMYTLFTICGYVIPLTFMTGLYVALIRFVKANTWSSRQESTKSLTPKRDKHADARMHRLTRLVVIIVVLFCVNWLPMHIYILMAFYGDSSLPSTRGFIGYRVFAQSLAYLNCCVNPLVYNCASTEFRDTFRGIFSCSRVKTKRSANGTEQFPLNNTRTCALEASEA